MSVTRWDYKRDGMYGMVSAKNGPWVGIADYDALAAELAVIHDDVEAAQHGCDIRNLRITALEAALSDGLNIARCAPTHGDLAPEWRSYMNAWGDRVTALVPQTETACGRPPDTIPFTDKPGGSLPWKCPTCGQLNSSWQTFCSNCTHDFPMNLTAETFAESKQFAPIGNGTICSNCTKTIGYHYQTAAGVLWCEVPKETKGDAIDT